MAPSMLPSRRLRALATESALNAIRRYTCPTPKILYFHRFAPLESASEHSAELLREQLAYLRRNSFAVVSLVDLVNSCLEGRPISHRTVAVTIDDGYLDFATVAQPIFAEFDCPVSVFLITDFVSGRIWNWWDQVEFILDREIPDSLLSPLNRAWSPTRLLGALPRTDGIEQVVESLKLISNVEREATIASMATTLEIEVPLAAPARYRAMTWDQVRQLSAKGVAFGPHTVTHPILSRVDAAQSEREIADSWQKVRAEVSGAIPVFCYPNGKNTDCDLREAASVSRAGMVAALTTTQGRLQAPADAGAVDRFFLPRWGCPVEMPYFMRVVNR